MITIKKIGFMILITTFIFSFIKFDFLGQISLPGQLKDLGLFLIIFIGPLISFLLQDKLFGQMQMRMPLSMEILNGSTHEKATDLLVQIRETRYSSISEISQRRKQVISEKAKE